MADTDISIVNGALGRLALSSIADFTSNDKAKICGAIYPKYINTLLTMHNWRFARKKSGSLTATTAPDNAWTYAYTLPADLLKIVNAYNSGEASALPLTYGYEVFGSDVLTNESSLYLDYTYTVDEDNWPDYFQNFAMTALAAVLALPLTEDESKENTWRNIAFGTPREGGMGGVFAMTRMIDTQQQPIMDIPIQSLTAYRFS